MKLLLLGMKRTAKPKIELRQSLFWDVDPKTIDLKRHATYVIERVLDFGNDKEVRWLWRTYGPSRIRKVLKKSRVLDAKSRNFWELITRPHNVAMINRR